MAAFSLASILGVPAGLELSARFGFRAPFFALAGVGLLITVLSTRLLPPLESHLQHPQKKGLLPTFDRLTLLSLANTALVMMGVFLVVPNLSAYVQHNLGYPRQMLGVLYLVGGVASFLAMQVAGFLVDRFGALPLVVVGTLFHLVALDLFFIDPSESIPLFVIFTLYMLSGSVRMVPMQTLATQVPQIDQRARFMSSQSAVQHLSSAAGAFAGSIVLIAQADGTLIGMRPIAWCAVAVASACPVLVFFLERGLKARAAVVSQGVAS
jgi:predicted MFS family arabinose efflux permease